MYLQKKPLGLIVAFFVLLASLASAMPLSAQEVMISRVRIFIGPDEYEWTEGGIAAVSLSGEKPSINPDTVVSWLSFAPGMRVSDRSVRVLCRESELRLLDSGYFYSADVSFIASKKDPALRTVFVNVTPGFLTRFNGGNAWGMIGRDGLFGERFGIRGFAGYNRDGLIVEHSRVAGIPLRLGASAFWYGPGEDHTISAVTGLPREGTPFEGTATIGWFALPDLFLGVDAAGSIPSPGSIPVSGYGRDGAFSLQPYVSIGKYFVGEDDPPGSVESDWGAELRGYAFPLTGDVKGEGSAFAHWRPFGLSSVCGKIAAGASSGSVGFELLTTENRSVRSGYSQVELSAGSFAFASVELRQSLPSFMIPPGFACELQGFAFADFALLSRVETESFADAYGLGARVLFRNPVYAYFTFSYGWNHDGEGRFVFACTAGF